jgi:hypothetical protein
MRREWLRHHSPNTLDDTETMEAPLKELEKLQKLVSDEPSMGKSKTSAIQDSLNSLLQTLHVQKKRLEAGLATEAELTVLARTVEARKKEIDERQKEIYNSLARYGKALDKRFTTPLPTYEPLFGSKEAQGSLEHVIAMHFLRTGRFSTAETFVQVPVILRYARDPSLKRNSLSLGVWRRFTPRATVTVRGPLSNIGRLAKQGHQACPGVRPPLPLSPHERPLIFPCHNQVGRTQP